MPAHEVKFQLTTKVVVAHKDVEIHVHTAGGKLGKLLVSRGNIEWRPANKSVKKHRLSWERFASLMADQGRTIRKRAR
jgi:hypothetical protein